MTDSDLIELYEERVAIRIYDGEMPERLALRAAYFDLRRLVGNVPVPEVIRDRVRLGEKVDAIREVG